MLWIHIKCEAIDKIFAGPLGIKHKHKIKKIGSLRLHAAQAYSRHIFEHKINV